MSAEADNPQAKGGGKTERAIELRRDEHHVTAYSNTAAVAIGFFEIRIAFGEIVQSGPEKLVLDNNVTVIMSPEHAKRLVTVLETNVRQYEERFGKIRDMPDAKDLLE
jgi:hypothetical protein